MIKVWILTITLTSGFLINKQLISGLIIAPSKIDCFNKAIYFKAQYPNIVASAACQEQWVPRGSYNAEVFNNLRIQ